MTMWLEVRTRAEGVALPRSSIIFTIRRATPRRGRIDAQRRFACRPSGANKTMLAKAVLGEANVPFFSDVGL